MKNILIISILLFANKMAIAQNFSHKAKIKKVDAKAFYQINLSPEINAYCQANNEDLRLFDDKGKEIPFLLKKQNQYSENENFIEYPIIENNTTNDWQTIIIKNENKSSIDEIILEMQNAEADRILRISGSNDASSYFVVKDNFGFSAYGEEINNEVKKVLSFPKTNYSYYKIEVKNKQKNPLNITRAGYVKKTSNNPIYQKLNGISFTQNELNKESIIKLTSNPAQRIDQIEIKIKEPQLYKRAGQILINNKKEENDEVTTSLNSMKKYRGENNYHSFELSSETTNIINTSDLLGYLPHDSIILQIVNQDNEALQIAEINAYQYTSTLTAELSPNRSYYLYFGDSSLVSPSYDLVYFQSKINKDIKQVEHEAVQRKQKANIDEYNNTNDKYLVWIGLAIVGSILLWLTSNMLSNMKKENK